MREEKGVEDGKGMEGQVLRFVVVVVVIYTSVFRRQDSEREREREQEKKKHQISRISLF